MNRHTHHFHVRAVINNGFTLLEVLVALVLLSLILMLLYGGLFTGARSSRAGELQARENEDKRLVLSFIRWRVGEAVPLLQLDRQEERVLFIGEDSSLQFVSHLPAHHAGSGVYFVKIEAQDNELALKYLPLARDKDLFAEDVFVAAEEIILLQHVETIDLDYFGRDTLDAAPAWRDDWDNKGRLPELIRFQVIADAPGSWPPLVIALRSQAVRGQPQLTLHREEDGVEG